ncbi:sensor histidine kinase [Mycobacterium numidiamassiliense]|uniref:sensor histidine kinase n=1 Tax=Mycobacterium numidiamassiliense TaxID=1841861 RepID=UPI0026AB294A
MTFLGECASAACQRHLDCGCLFNNQRKDLGDWQLKPSHVSESGRKREAWGGQVTDTELEGVLRVHRWRALRIAAVQRTVVAFIMVGAALVDRDHSRWTQQGTLLGGYILIALSVLILGFSHLSRSLAANRTLHVLAMVDVVAIVGFNLLSPAGYLPLLLMVMVPRMVALDVSEWRAALGLTLAFGVFTASIIQDPFITGRLGWPQVLLIVLIYGFICGTALLAVVFRLRHFGELAKMTASREALLAETMTASDTERREISEAIHDGPLQDVLAARRDIVDFIKKSPAEPLQRAVASLDDASRRLREATFELHPAVLEQVGLGAAVEKLAAFTAERSGIAITTDIDYPCRNAIDPMVFGVVRELLSNVVRHSGASHASVKLKVAHRECQLAVQDDGVGINADVVMRRLADGHIGLASQRARVDAAGGTLRIVDVPTGTHICVDLPLPG